MCRIAGYSPGEAPSESVRRGHVNGVGVAQSHGLHAARRLRESANRCTALRRSVERNGHESQAGKDKITKISTGSIVIAVWGTRPPRERRAVHQDTASPLRVFRRGYRGSLTGANCGQRPNRRATMEPNTLQKRTVGQTAISRCNHHAHRRRLVYTASAASWRDDCRTTPDGDPMDPIGPLCEDEIITRSGWLRSRRCLRRVPML
jgi:hypothetical protein